MADIFEEVVSDTAYEKKVLYFKKILPIIIITTVLVVIIMIVFGWYSDRKTQHNVAMSELLLKNLLNDPSKAVSTTESQYEELDYIIGNAEGSRVAELAALKEVAIKLELSDTVEAKAILTQLIDTESVSENTAAYARLSWIGLVINENEIAATDKSKLIEYMEYFKETTPYYGTASIMKSMWYVRNSKISEAKSLLNKLILTKTMPQIIKDQATAMLENIENNR